MEGNVKMTTHEEIQNKMKNMSGGNIKPNIDIYSLEKTYSDSSDFYIKIKSAKTKAKNAKTKAEAAKVDIGHLGKDKKSPKEAIKLLQEVTEEIAISQGDTVDIQETTFNNQKSLAELITKLYDRCVLNIKTIHENLNNIQLGLINATGEEKEQARKNLEDALSKLQEQENIYINQVELRYMVEEHKDEINAINEEIDDLKETVKLVNEKVIGSIQRINHLANEGNRLDRKIDNNTEIIQRNIDEIKLISVGLKRQEDVLSKSIRDFDVHISETHKTFDKKIDVLKENGKKISSDLKDYIDRNISKTKTNIEEKEKILSTELAGTKEKLSAIELHMSKKTWKIGVSIVAGISLLINVLQLFGIL